MYPKAWAKGGPHELEIDSIGNIAAISSYTNRWIGRRSPATYVEELLTKVSSARLDEILDGHLASRADLVSEDYQTFVEARIDRIHAYVQDLLTARV